MFGHLLIIDCFLIKYKHQLNIQNSWHIGQLSPTRWTPLILKVLVTLIAIRRQHLANECIVQLKIPNKKIILIKERSS